MSAPDAVRLIWREGNTVVVEIVDPRHRTDFYLVPFNDWMRIQRDAARWQAIEERALQISRDST